ncbi:hypothetical protein BJ508DRAFT_341119, partial [Ascobolus immersus RN42]
YLHNAVLRKHLVARAEVKSRFKPPASFTTFTMEHAWDSRPDSYYLSYGNQPCGLIKPHHDLPTQAKLPLISPPNPVEAFCDTIVYRNKERNLEEKAYIHRRNRFVLQGLGEIWQASLMDQDCVVKLRHARAYMRLMEQRKQLAGRFTQARAEIIRRTEGKLDLLLQEMMCHNKQ